MKINLSSRSDLCNSLASLYQKVSDLETNIPTADDIQNLGSEIKIRVTKVKIAEGSNGILQFNPRFFLPHPENVLEEYPIDVKATKSHGHRNIDIIQSKLKDRAACCPRTGIS
ncbi:uncharacterized protein N7483_005404 [Penicillium malachiteum]|uniref:uncharacterized protein n=1 Tax=Penicillium malachiteum TaxID=1324776 RepID=UPI0025472841|nr:uncharacterized protein N7483_005404 [Penicillium malachiteum]KAJ5730896.1 hypothetical protein N7483_005404 [Penicillium malachiteum]